MVKEFEGYQDTAVRKWEQWRVRKIAGYVGYLLGVANGQHEISCSPAAQQPLVCLHGESHQAPHIKHGFWASLKFCGISIGLQITRPSISNLFIPFLICYNNSPQVIIHLLSLSEAIEDGSFHEIYWLNHVLQWSLIALWSSDSFILPTFNSMTIDAVGLL